MLVPLEGRIAARLDLEVSGDEAERLFAHALAQQGLAGHVAIGHVASLVVPPWDTGPPGCAELEELRWMIHVQVPLPRRPAAVPPRPARIPRTGGCRGERSCPGRAARSRAARA